MRLTILLLLFFGSFSLFAQTTITLTATNLPLEKMMLQLEEEHGFLFSYTEADIKDISISIKVKDEENTVFFQKLTAQTALHFEIVNGNYVIVTKKNTPAVSSENLTQICGKVLDEFTQSPLPYANVYFQKSQKGVYTKSNGHFNFSADLSTFDTLIISYVGYEEQRLPSSFFKKKPCPTIELKYTFLPDQIIVVKDYLTDGIDLGNNGLSTNIRLNRLENLPGQSEPDVLKTIQFLPGVTSPDNASSSIYIRGGTPDQNLILWENIPIYHSAHYFGLISAFNPYIIDEVQVYRSGFGAQYGGRAAGVIDLSTASLQQPNASFGAGVNATTMYLFGKIPLAKNRVSAVFSARRSINDLWETPTYRNLTNRALQGISFGKFTNIRKLPKDTEFKHDFDFSDANLKVSANLSNKTKVSVSLFHSKNHLDNFFQDNRSTLVQRDSFDLKHEGGSLNLQQEWSDNFSSKITFVASDYNYNYFHSEKKAPPNMRDEFVSKMSKIKERQLIFSNAHSLSKNFRFQWGYHLTNYDVESGTEERRRNRPPISEGIDAKGKLQAFFAEIASDENQRISGELGLRYSYYNRLKKSYFEPRFHAKFAAMESLDFHINAGKYHQFLNQRIELKLNRPSLLNNQIWVLANNGQSPVVTAYQYQIGAIFSRNSWVVDLQGYYKKMNGITSASLGFALVPQAGYDSGSSEIKGIDLLLKKRWKNYRSWVSYSLSKVDYSFNNYDSASFPAIYDQRHSFNWVNLFTYQNWEFSLGFSLTSGTPYTVITDYELLPPPMPGPSLLAVDYDAINGENLPFNHHLDAAILYHFSPKRTGQWFGHLGFSVFNIYNQQNIHTREYSVITEGEDEGINVFDYKTLGFTPNLVLRIEWK